MAIAFKRTITVKVKGKPKTYEYWFIRYKDATGKWKTRSCGQDVTKKSEAQAIASTYSARELNYRHKAPIRIIKERVHEALIFFRDNELAGINKEQSSIKREGAIVNTFAGFLKDRGIKDFKEIRNGVIKEFLRAREAIGRKPKTLISELRIVRKFFDFAVENSYCAENPVNGTARPRVIPKRPRYFSENELKEIFSTARDPYCSIFKFLYLTGIRTGELGNLEWQDFKEDEKRINLRVMSGNKTKRECSVPLNKKAFEIILGRRILGEHDQFIFCNGELNQLDNENIYRNLMKLLNRLEIKNASPHTFRHTTASHLVMAGVPIYTVKELLRHQSVRETEIYAHLAEKTVKEAVETLRV